MAFFSGWATSIFVFFFIQGFVALQNDYFWSATKPLLHCKTTTVAMQ